MSVFRVWPRGEAWGQHTARHHLHSLGGVGTVLACTPEACVAEAESIATERVLASLSCVLWDSAHTWGVGVRVTCTDVESGPIAALTQ